MPQYQPVFELSSLNGANGFRIDGEAEGNLSGRSVASAGDVNGDGYADLIIGAPRADPNGERSGASYVVFGKASGFGATFDLSSLNGANGFKINGDTAGDYSGNSVASAGDINGDGFADMIVGAYGADPNGNVSGASYVVFGKASGFTAKLELGALNGTNGFQINGETPADRSGSSVASAGDVNGDGFADLIVGADGADPHGGYSGASYVVFGKASGFSTTLELSALDGTNGFQINGAAAGDASGRSVASAGDVNGDGFADLIIGAPSADPNGNPSGASYVVFGKATGFNATLNLSSLNGHNGFRIVGEFPNDFSGRSVASAGDVNGDGYADLIVGAPAADPNGQYSGESYVVFGKASGFDANLFLTSLDGSNGFEICGEEGYSSGSSVASAGDFNGDGFADLIVNAQFAAPNGAGTGASYLVFGKASGFGKTLDVSSLDGDNGIQINGVGGDDLTGDSVASAGDVNGDGLDDLIIGTVNADPHGDSSGSSYVVFGALPTGSVNRTGTAAANTIHGSNSDDTLSGLGGADILLGHGGQDTLFGGNGNDTLYGGDSNDTIYTGSGIDTVYGGEGNDRILAGADFAAGDVMHGEAGTDVVVLDGRYNTLVLTASQFDSVERLELTAGHSFKFSVDNSLLAHGHAFAIDGRNLGAHDKLVVNGKGEHDGYLELYGGAANDKMTLGNGGGYAVSSLGNDTMTAGHGNDTFYFDDPATSTGLGFDTVVKFDFTGDLFDVSVVVSDVDSKIATGALGKTHFDADLAFAADNTHLLANHAVIFMPTTGTYHGKTFLVIDQNGAAGYQAGHDIVIQLKGAIDLANIDAGDFTTFF